MEQQHIPIQKLTEWSTSRYSTISARIPQKHNYTASVGIIESNASNARSREGTQLLVLKSSSVASSPLRKNDYPKNINFPLQAVTNIYEQSARQLGTVQPIIQNQKKFANNQASNIVENAVLAESSSLPAVRGEQGLQTIKQLKVNTQDRYFMSVGRVQQHGTSAADVHQNSNLITNNQQQQNGYFQNARVLAQQGKPKTLQYMGFLPANHTMLQTSELQFEARSNTRLNNSQNNSFFAFNKTTIADNYNQREVFVPPLAIPVVQQVQEMESQAPASARRNSLHQQHSNYRYEQIQSDNGNNLSGFMNQNTIWQKNVMDRTVRVNLPRSVSPQQGTAHMLSPKQKLECYNAPQEVTKYSVRAQIACSKGSKIQNHLSIIKQASENRFQGQQQESQNNQEVQQQNISTAAANHQTQNFKENYSTLSSTTIAAKPSIKNKYFVPINSNPIDRRYFTSNIVKNLQLHTVEKNDQGIRYLQPCEVQTAQQTKSVGCINQMENTDNILQKSFCYNTATTPNGKQQIFKVQKINLSDNQISQRAQSSEKPPQSDGNNNNNNNKYFCKMVADIFLAASEKLAQDIKYSGETQPNPPLPTTDNQNLLEKELSPRVRKPSYSKNAAVYVNSNSNSNNNSNFELSDNRINQEHSVDRRSRRQLQPVRGASAASPEASVCLSDVNPNLSLLKNSFQRKSNFDVLIEKALEETQVLVSIKEEKAQTRQQQSCLPESHKDASFINNNLDTEQPQSAPPQPQKLYLQDEYISEQVTTPAFEKNTSPLFRQREQEQFSFISPITNNSHKHANTYQLEQIDSVESYRSNNPDFQETTASQFKKPPEQLEPFEVRNISDMQNYLSYMKQNNQTISKKLLEQSTPPSQLFAKRIMAEQSHSQKKNLQIAPPQQSRAPRNGSTVIENNKFKKVPTKKISEQQGGIDSRKVLNYLRTMQKRSGSQVV